VPLADERVRRHMAAALPEGKPPKKRQRRSRFDFFPKQYPMRRRSLVGAVDVKL